MCICQVLMRWFLLRLCSPYEAPHFAEVLGIELPEAPGEVVRDSDVVRIDPEVLKSDMNGEEGGREEET